ncbi:MAG: hypothetical protein Kow0069_08060 [Promethearchaeota archaeon]
MVEAVIDFPLVRALEEAVVKWRNEGADWDSRYLGATRTSKMLLGYWFENDHETSEGDPFAFYPIQQIAVETLIYIFEVLGANNVADVVRLVMNDELRQNIDKIPEEDEYPKFCFKMATGSGKTFVMALAIVWIYFNYLKEPEMRQRLSNMFLILAPNVIVYERLAKDLRPIEEPSSLFFKYPFIPNHLKPEFKPVFIYRSNLRPVDHDKDKGAVFVTNVQQIYHGNVTIPAPILEASVVSAADYQPVDLALPEQNRLRGSLAQFDKLVVINDEAHHLHSPLLAWNRVLWDLHQKARGRNEGGGIQLQLDFTATPRYQSQQDEYFAHVVVDYPLASAIRDRIVKIPRLGKVTGAPPIQTDDFALKNQYLIHAGIAVREECQRSLKILGKKAVLFIMADNNAHADRVKQFVTETYPNYTNRNVLLIHTVERGEMAGEIRIEDVDELREAARTIDDPENPYEIIVSVMMLKEGWDVRSVVVIVPLRSYESKILMEQTLGRGLRKQFPGADEYLTVIEHERFTELIREALQENGLEDEVNFWEVPLDHVQKLTQGGLAVHPLDDKLEFDIQIPLLSGGFFLQEISLDEFKWEELPSGVLDLSSVEVRDPRYYELEFNQEMKIVKEMDLLSPFVHHINDYLVHLTRKILKRLHLSVDFGDFLFEFKEYIQNRFFTHPVEEFSDEVMKKLNHPVVVVKLFNMVLERASRLVITRTVLERSQQTVNLSQTPAAYISKKLKRYSKTVFNLVPLDSHLEEAFADYLEEDTEVRAFCKLIPKICIVLYYNNRGFLRRYVPDFIVETIDGKYYLVETKGQHLLNSEETRLKAKAGREWAAAAGANWEYLLVGEDDFFSELRWVPFPELVRRVKGRGEI